jgi:hypothetical protein
MPSYATGNLAVAVPIGCAGGRTMLTFFNVVKLVLSEYPIEWYSGNCSIRSNNHRDLQRESHCSP